MASFGSDGAGCYVLEAGSYGISIRSDSHTVIAEQTYEVPETVVYDETNKRSTDEKAAVTPLADSEGNVEYLSRADGFANYETATAAPSDYNLSDEYREARSR